MTAPTIGTGRAVEVLHDRGPVTPVDVNRWTGGSGYLIGGRLVLTAAHTVDYRQDLGDNAQLLVRTIKGTEFAAQVVLVSDESSQVDLALLEISDPRFDEHLPPVSFARVNRDSPASVSACWSVGFPRFGEAGPVLLEGSRRETWHVRGDILPGGKLRSGLLSLQVTSTPQPLLAPLGGSEWEGMSGAVVFASDSPDSDRAIGVVSMHHRPEGESALTVVPITAVGRLSIGVQWWHQLGVPDPDALPVLPRQAPSVAEQQRPRQTGEQALMAADRISVVGERVSAAVDVFRDRTDRRAQLRGLVLSREKRIISVTGRRGIGKSGLVAKVLADFEEPSGSGDDYVDGLAYVSTRTGVGKIDLARIFHALSNLLPQGQRDRLEEKWANVGAEALDDLFYAIQDRKTVIVLDNLDDLQDQETGRLNGDDLLRFVTVACRYRNPPLIITTSQHPLGLPSEISVHATRIDIAEGLDPEEALQLLRQLDSDGEAGLRDLPDRELRKAVELVHGTPRGLELLAAQLTDRRTATLQRILEAKDTPEVLLGRLVSEGFHSLGSVGQDVVRLLALADTPLPIEVFPGMLEHEHPGSAVEQTVERLVNWRIIGFDRASGTARLHPMDSDYVRKTLLDDPEQRTALDLRLADWLHTQRTDPSAWRTSTDVAPQRREIRHRLRAGDGHGAIQAIADIADFLAIRGEADQLAESLNQSERYANTPDLRAAYELSRGLAEWYTGSLEGAVAAFRTGRTAAAQAGNQLLAARLNMLLGGALRQIGDPAAAREPLAKACALPATDQASREIVMGSLFDAGMVACYLHDAKGAADAIIRAEGMLRTEDPSVWSAWLANLRALAALLNHDYTAALTEIRQGIEKYTDSVESVMTGYLVNVRGLVLLAQARTREAAREFEAAYEDAAAVRLARLEGLSALNLAWTRLIEGDRTAAAALARKAADRFSANLVREAESADALAVACQAGGVNEMLTGLRRAVRVSGGNPDLYQPSDKTLVLLAQARNNPHSVSPT
jgi:tetratricopeptide (TPR) repeat protein